MCSKTFAAPTKDEAQSTNFMRPGDVYGVGKREPIGKMSNSGKSVVPMGSQVTVITDGFFE